MDFPRGCPALDDFPDGFLLAFAVCCLSDPSETKRIAPACIPIADKHFSGVILESTSLILLGHGVWPYIMR